MIKLLIYHVLVLCCLSSLFTGRRWVLYALALFAPMVEVLPSPYGFILSPPNALLLGLGGLALRAGREDNPGEGVPNASIMVLWTLVLFAGVLRTIVAPIHVVGVTVEHLETARRAWYWTTPFVLYAMIYRVVVGKELARRIIIICMISAVGEAVLALNERLQGVGRASAHLGEPNKAGAYFGAMGVLMFAFVLIEKGRRRWLFLAGWTITMGALFATLSRGGMVAAAFASAIVFGAFYLFSEHKDFRAKTGYLIMAVLVAVNITLFLPERVMERILFTVQKDSGSVENVDKTGTSDSKEMDGASEGRLELWTAGLTLFREQPSGYGAFTSIPLQVRFRGQGKAMHNIYLQVLVEHGIQGLICLLLYVVMVGRNLWCRFKLARDDPERSALFLGLFGYWVALCAAHFFVNPFFMLHLTGQFWVMSGCAMRNSPDPRGAH